MAPKRRAASSSAGAGAPSTPKRARTTTTATAGANDRTKDKGKAKQQTLASFFSPPSKTKTASALEVIDLVDSDDEDDVQVVDYPVLQLKRNDASERIQEKEGDRESDEAMARRLAAEWAEEDGADQAQADTKVEVKAEDDSEVLVVIKSETKPDPASAPKLTRTLHSLFQPPSSAGPSRATQPAPTAIDFDTDSLLFCPEDIDTSLWPAGHVPYAVLVGAYTQVAGTRSRLAIVRVLTNFLHFLLARAPGDTACALYLLSNHLAPAYERCELGVGSSVLTRVLKDVSGLQARDLRALWARHGDAGDVAFAAKRNLRTLVQPAPLIMSDVYTRLRSLARITGPQSGKVKADAVRKLLVQARGEEVRFLVRSLIGNLRIGAVRLTLLTALGRAAVLHAASPADLAAVLPLPAKGKGKPDAARAAIEASCAAAVRGVRQVYVRRPNYGDLVSGLQGGIEDLTERVPLSVGIPLCPMLGSITRSLTEVYERLGERPFTAEEKLDGQRLQMHVRVAGRAGGEGEEQGGTVIDGVRVRLFSRHLEDMTEKYPDVCAMAARLVSRDLPASPAPFPPTSSPPSMPIASLLASERITSLVLDAEIVAVDTTTGARRTFQELTNRARKDVRVEDIRVVVAVCAFDLMLLNDVPLLSAPFVHRRHLLRTLLPPLVADAPAAQFAQVESVDSRDMGSRDELRAFFDKVVARRAEGLMIKLLEGERREGPEEVDEDGVADEDEGEDDNEEEDEGDQDESADKSRKKPLPATYEPDQRSMGWLKVKKDYLEGMGDSLDLVPIGAWWGMGRKAGWWSPILLAARNPDSGALEAVCKCMSGFNDAFYKDLLVQYPPKGEPDVCAPGTDAPLGYVETGGLVPDVWFVPREVWEIRGADITLSPVYPAGAAYIGGERGLSLRFPRFIRRREDKTIDEATTSEEFADMYRRQMARPTPPTSAAVELGDEQEAEV